jgi:hypothetical protein
MRRAKPQAVGASVDQPNKWMLVRLIISKEQIRFGESRIPAKFGIGSSHDTSRREKAVRLPMLNDGFPLRCLR